MSEYTCDYFIAKFSAIPDELWCTDRLTDGAGRRCAYGHCDPHNGCNSVEGRALANIERQGFKLSFASVNDGADSRYPQPSPRARILAALTDIKRKQQEASK